MNLPWTCRFERKRYAMDSLGGKVVNHEVRETGVSCFPQPAGQSEVKEYAQQNQRITHKIYFDSLQDLQPGDVVQVESGPEVGRRFDFKSGDWCTAGIHRYWKAMVELERHEGPRNEQR